MLRVGSGSTWVNWAGTATATPAAIAHPASTDEVAALMVEARASGLTVKAVGSGHSFTPVAVTDGVLVQLDRLRGIVSADVPTGMVRVRAGTPLHQLNAALAALGLAMPNLGDIDRQTDQRCPRHRHARHGRAVPRARRRGARRADRPRRRIGPRLRRRQRAGPLRGGADRPRRPRHHHRADAAVRARLPAAGAWRIRDRCPERSRTSTTLVDGTDHFEFYWFPHTDRVLTKRNTRLPVESGERSRCPRGGRGSTTTCCRTASSRRSTGSAPRDRRGCPRINRVTQPRSCPRASSPTASHRVFASQRDVRFREMEYAVPRARRCRRPRLAASDFTDRAGLAHAVPGRGALRRGRRRLAVDRARRGSRPTSRCTSTTAWSTEAYFDAVEAMAREVDGRPHWGKLHGRSRADLRAGLRALRRLRRACATASILTACSRTTTLRACSAPDRQARSELGSAERDREAVAPDRHAGELRQVDVCGNRIVLAALVALQGAQVDVLAVVEHEPAARSVDHWRIGEPDLQVGTVVGVEVLDPQHARAVGELEDPDAARRSVLVGDELPGGQGDRLGRDAPPRWRTTMPPGCCSTWAPPRRL